MSNPNNVTLWEEQPASLLPAHLSQPAEIAAFARQLSTREKQQVVAAYRNESFEMATSFVWGRAMASLKRELGSLGITFLAEVLSRTDIPEDANVLEAITDKEAIRLAQELGVVSQTDAIRLRQTQELVSHFAHRDPAEGEEPMEAMEAGNVLLNCVKTVLSKPSIQVAKRFADFRKDLESETFGDDDPRCDTLEGSPYFFRRLAVAVLLSGIRVHTGAKLEHCLANLNLLLPLLWPKLREPERWQVGTTYAQVYGDGLKPQTTGIRQALLKIKGFDYVPENLRSQTFIKAAEAIIVAHEGVNNFYNEEGPTLNLEKLGTTLPAPALGQCITALLCVKLGNSYGTCWAAVPIAERMLKKQAVDRWTYYLDKVLPGEPRILEKLLDDKPQKNWMKFMPSVVESGMAIKDKNIRELVFFTRENDSNGVALAAKKILSAYYGKGMQKGIA